MGFFEMAAVGGLRRWIFRRVRKRSRLLLRWYLRKLVGTDWDRGLKGGD